MNDLLSEASILVVEDTPLHIKVLGTILSKYDIRVATSGPEALEIAGSEIPPDLILLDIMMPDMNGYEVCRRLKENEKTRDIPVIFITAKSETLDETKGLSLGAVDYITKPFNIVIVKTKIRTHLELKRHRDNLEKIVEERTTELLRINQELREDNRRRQEIEEELTAYKERCCLLEGQLADLKKRAGG